MANTRKPLTTSEEIWDAALSDTPIDDSGPKWPDTDGRRCDVEPVSGKVGFSLGVLVGLLYNMIGQGIFWCFGGAN